MSKRRPSSSDSAVSDLFSPRLFKALCDPTRIKLISELIEARAPRSVSQIAERCPVDISVVSRHLAQLKDAGILEAEKRGREVYYSIHDGVGRRLRAVADLLDACCGAQNGTKE